MMENPELLLLEIEEFNRTNNTQDDKLPQNLENFIEYVSKTGTYIYPWYLVKKVFMKKIQNIINNLQSCMSLSTSDLNTSSSPSYGPNPSMFNDANGIQIIKDRIIERMKSFTSAPFTIQRICELLLKPNNHYNRVDKYLRGLEKCIMVVTTVDPNGNKIFMENYLINGISTTLTPSNPSTPLITPTRPTTPPVSEETSNESLSLAPPKIEIKTEDEKTAEIFNQVTSLNSDEISGEYKTEFNELNEKNEENEIKVDTEPIKIEIIVDDVVKDNNDQESKNIEITEEIQKDNDSIEIDSNEITNEVVSSTEMIEVPSTNITDDTTDVNINIEDEAEVMDGVKTTEVSVTTTTTMILQSTDQDLVEASNKDLAIPEEGLNQPEVENPVFKTNITE
jgi:serine/threonine-protein phosphatase 4 regulatory subunit 2